MKTFGKIESQFWDTMRHEELSDQGKLLAAYLLTCKHGNMIGIFSLPRAYIMGDLKWDAETVEITVSELLANRFLSVSAKTDYICINKFMSHNRAENVKQMEARLRLLLNLPESLSNDVPMFTNLVSGELLKAGSFKGGSETRRLIELVRSKFTKCSEPVSEPLANSEEKVRPENKRNREEEKKRRREIFTRHMSDLTIARPPGRGKCHQVSGARLVRPPGRGKCHQLLGARLVRLRQKLNRAKLISLNPSKSGGASTRNVKVTRAARRKPLAITKPGYGKGTPLTTCWPTS